MRLMMAATTVLVLTAGSAMAGKPDATKYPNLVKSWEALQAAKGHVEHAEANHAKHGTLGGHGAEAVKDITAAEREIDEAVTFAETHAKPGAPGVVKPKPGLTAHPEHANLGEAELQVEWAIAHLEDAMEYHAPIGTLGGHGKNAVDHLKAALKQLAEAERWAETHK